MITFPEIHNLGTYNLVYLTTLLTAVPVFNPSPHRFHTGANVSFCAALLNLFLTDIIKCKQSVSWPHLWPLSQPLAGAPLADCVGKWAESAARLSNSCSSPRVAERPDETHHRTVAATITSDFLHFCVTVGSLTCNVPWSSWCCDLAALQPWLKHVCVCRCFLYSGRSE